jgi:hypothetical protein
VKAFRTSTRRRLAWLAATALLAACSPLADLGLDKRPVFITQPIDGSTRGRLLNAVETPPACMAWLAQNGLTFRPVADRSEGEFCQVTGAGNLADDAKTDPPFSPARPMMDCGLAATTAIWRRQSVEPAAREILGSEVRTIDQLGVYACRNVGDAETGRPSAHARAQAIDIAGFRLSDGRRITVAKDWAGAGPEAAFLRRVRDDACRLYGVTLSPDYNAAHANHLHLEAGRGRLCS